MTIDKNVKNNIEGKANVFTLTKSHEENIYWNNIKKRMLSNKKENQKIIVLFKISLTK